MVPVGVRRPKLRPRFDVGVPLTTVLGSTKLFTLVSILATSALATFIAPQLYTALAPADQPAHVGSSATAATAAAQPRSRCCLEPHAHTLHLPLAYPPCCSPRCWPLAALAPPALLTD